MTDALEVDTIDIWCLYCIKFVKHIKILLDKKQYICKLC